MGFNVLNFSLYAWHESLTHFVVLGHAMKTSYGSISNPLPLQSVNHLIHILAMKQIEAALAGGYVRLTADTYFIECIS